MQKILDIKFGIVKRCILEGSRQFKLLQLQAC